MFGRKKKWVRVHIPDGVAKLVGETGVRLGVPPATAISAALWAFGRALNFEERRSLIREYLELGTESTAV